MRRRARIWPDTLIVAAISARPFVIAAAKAGFRGIAADAFGDTDTRAHAAQVLQLGYADGGFVITDVRAQLPPLLAAGAGLIYGSGFETQPQLLDDLACHGAVYGNSAQTVRMLKHPGRFFALLRDLDIPHPETRIELPEQPAGWLSKIAGGSGGVHVLAADTAHDKIRRYFQRQVAGLPCSLLFLANGRDIAVVGYNLQWLAPAPGMPFRYGGAVSQAPLPKPVCAAMHEAARRLARAAGLRGLNSLDCMVDGEFVWVLEVNPRLSASFALYDLPAGGANLLRAHLLACVGTLAWVARKEEASAQLIYYAPFHVTVPAAMDWPPWVADVPPAGSRVVAGDPLCSILACAPDAAGAAALVRLRERQLQEQLQHFENHNE